MRSSRLTGSASFRSNRRVRSYELLSLAAVLVTLVGCNPESGKASAAEVVDGRALFAMTCARCHGPEGNGGPASWDGGPAPRNFHDRAFQSSRTDEQLAQVIREGKGGAMPPFGSLYDDKQVAALVRHLRSCDPGR